MKRRQRRNYRETTPWEMVAIQFELFIELEKRDEEEAEEELQRDNSMGDGSYTLYEFKLVLV